MKALRRVNEAGRYLQSRTTRPGAAGTFREKEGVATATVPTRPQRPYDSFKQGESPESNFRPSQLSAGNTQGPQPVWSKSGLWPSIKPRDHFYFPPTVMAAITEIIYMKRWAQSLAEPKLSEYKLLLSTAYRIFSRILSITTAEVISKGLISNKSQAAPFISAINKLTVFPSTFKTSRKLLLLCVLLVLSFQNWADFVS